MGLSPRVARPYQYVLRDTEQRGLCLRDGHLVATALQGANSAQEGGDTAGTRGHCVGTPRGHGDTAWGHCGDTGTLRGGHHEDRGDTSQVTLWARGDTTCVSLWGGQG